MSRPENAALPWLERAAAHGDRTAVVDDAGEHGYRDLLAASARVAAALAAGGHGLEGARVAILIPPSFDFVAAQWGVWRAGGVAVPLALSQPPAEHAFVLEDCGVTHAVADPALEPRLRPLAEERGLRLLSVGEAVATGGAGDDAAFDPERGALILYTSGTTGRPKGVVLSHRNVLAQVENLVAAWRWSRDDRILGVLPLHHVHGLINVIACALWSGATCEVLPRFDAAAVWDRLASGAITLFMAVPTIYVRLIRAWEEADPARRRALSRAAAAARLMVSGSAALPVPVLERWREISGHVLLERYGMTEIGMALSNPYDGERRPGAVGTPLPGVEVRLVDGAGREVAPGEPGEIVVRGATVFREYWRRPEATLNAFRDGWFLTGDVAVVDDDAYRILGRQSIDIIKCGGEKISALEIEAVLLTHPRIEECAVVGVDDAEWGQRVAAALVTEGGEEIDLETLRAWAKERLAIYKVPSLVRCLDRLPRNAMGKVTKPTVAEILASPWRGGEPEG